MRVGAAPLTCRRSGTLELLLCRSIDGMMRAADMRYEPAPCCSCAAEACESRALLLWLTSRRSIPGAGCGSASL